MAPLDAQRCLACHQLDSRGTGIDYVAGREVGETREQVPVDVSIYRTRGTRVTRTYADFEPFVAWFCDGCVARQSAKKRAAFRQACIAAAIGAALLVFGIAVKLPVILHIPALVGALVLFFGMVIAVQNARRTVTEPDLRSWFRKDLEQAVHGLDRTDFWTRQDYEAMVAASRR